MPDAVAEVDADYGPGSFAYAQRFVLMFAGAAIKKDPELWDAESRVITDECADQIADLVSAMLGEAWLWLYGQASEWEPEPDEDGITWEEAAGMVRHSCD